MGVTDRLTCGIHGRVTGICHLCADERHNRDLTAALAAKERAERALLSINEIRNSIIGTQKMNWSEHVYPLVEALNGAGFEGMPYDEARGKFGTMLERTRKAESERDALAAKLAEAERTNVALAALVSAAKEDAGRYRWLRGDGGPSSLRWPLWCVQHWTGHWNPVSEFEMDEAIDAAISQERSDA